MLLFPAGQSQKGKNPPKGGGKDRPSRPSPPGPPTKSPSIAYDFPKHGKSNSIPGSCFGPPQLPPAPLWPPLGGKKTNVACPNHELCAYEYVTPT